MQPGSCNICLVAGEASGDLQGSLVIPALRARLESEWGCKVSFWGVCGPRMAELGVEALLSSSELAVMGLFSVIAAYPRISRAYRLLLREIENRRPNLVILIDYPGFNLRLARDISHRGIPVAYHIPPKVWAHGWKRVDLLRQYTSLVTSILPFETAQLRAAGVNAVFVGNPLRDAVADYLQANSLGVSGRKSSLSSELPHFVGIFPGSRKAEVSAVLPRLALAFLALSERLPVVKRARIAVAIGLEEAFLRATIVAAFAAIGRPESLLDELFEFCAGSSYQVMNWCDYAWVCSGTAALELAFFGKPMAVVYRMSPISWELGKLIVKLRWISLPNLCANAAVVRELLQDEFTTEKLIAHAESLLCNSEYYAEEKNRLWEVTQKFTLGASQRAADALADFVLGTSS